MSLGKTPCPGCGGPLHRGSPRCRKCVEATKDPTRTHERIKDVPMSLPLEDRLLVAVRRVSAHGGATPIELGKMLRTSPGAILDALLSLKQQGRRLHQFGDKWSEEQTPTGGTYDHALTSDKDGWHIFGAMGDTHLCSKQERLEELHDLYRIYAANGIRTVFHAGNYIDGEAKFNKFELKVHGMDAQLAYLGEHYPSLPGGQTLMISGDDHEGWFNQSSGVDIGYYMQKVMERSGRTDIKNLGYMECFVPLRHAESGAETKLHVMHPGGGSAYATSYTVQKICESYEGGEKPAILLAGHYHKAEHLEIRNIHCFQTGCFQDQTIFARKKRLTFTIGGWIIMARQNPETGAVEEVVSYFKSYYNTKYYVNNRWSLSGPVTQVPRLVL
jgi:hypothetical protein